MEVDDLLRLTGDRRDTFTMVVAHARKHAAKVIIETGTMRNEREGMSTLLLATLAAELRARFYSIDSDENAAVRAARYLPLRLYRTVHFRCADSAAELADLRIPIDVLYLDSMDAHEALPYQEHQLMEARAALPWLTVHPIVLLDDDLDDTGKGSRARPLLLDHGFTLRLRAYQSVFTRESEE